jgi:hypothetical protein
LLLQERIVTTVMGSQEEATLAMRDEIAALKATLEDQQAYRHRQVLEHVAQLSRSVAALHAQVAHLSSLPAGAVEVNGVGEGGRAVSLAALPSDELDHVHATGSMPPERNGETLHAQAFEAEAIRSAPVHGRAAAVAAAAAKREMLPLLATISVFWDDTHEWRQTTILGYRAQLVSGSLAFRHVCEYSSGPVEHDLGRVPFKMMKSAPSTPADGRESSTGAQLRWMERQMSRQLSV